MFHAAQCTILIIKDLTYYLNDRINGLDAIDNVVIVSSSDNKVSLVITGSYEVIGRFK